MTRTIKSEYINKLQGRIDAHHSFLKIMADIRAAEVRHYGFGEELFHDVYVETKDYMRENVEEIGSILTAAYDDWSGIRELEEDSNVDKLDVFSDAYQTFLEAVDNIKEEDEKVAGTIRGIHAYNDEYIGMWLPKNFLTEVCKVVTRLVVINNEELGIL